jgi:tetratricopeptide (TPR) repeat protein
MLNLNASRNKWRAGVVALALLMSFVSANPARADDLADAQQLFKAGQRDQALDKVNRVLAASPKEPQARFLKGVILTEQGKQAEAIDIFTKLTQDYPSLPEPYNNLAVIYANQGQYDKARTALEQSIRTHPSYATAYENLGDVYAKLASQAYGKALQLDASNTGAQNKLSMVKELVRDQPSAKPPVVVAQKAPEPAPPAKKEAAKEEKPTPKPAPATDGTAEVMKAVNGWAQAWSNKDPDAYLAHYAKDFKTPGGEPRAQWEQGRRERISAPKSIHVGIEQPKVTMKGPQEASVSFRQSYRSDKLKTTSRKTLDLVKADGRWLIREEKSGK